MNCSSTTPNTENVVLWLRQGESAAFEVDALSSTGIPVARIEPDDCSDKAIITTKKPHCINIGDVYRLVDVCEPYPNLNDLCLTIVDILDAHSFRIPYSIEESLIATGELFKVIDLSNVDHFDGQIRPKTYGLTGHPPVRVSVKQGSTVVATPYIKDLPLKNGDVINIPTLGVENVRIHNLHRVDNIIKFHIDKIPSKTGCEFASLNTSVVAPIRLITQDNCHLFDFNLKFDGKCGRILMGIRVQDLNCIPINWARSYNSQDLNCEHLGFYGGYEYGIVAKWLDGRQIILQEGDLWIKPSVYRS